MRAQGECRPRCLGLSIHRPQWASRRPLVLGTGRVTWSSQPGLGILPVTLSPGAGSQASSAPLGSFGAPLSQAVRSQSDTVEAFAPGEHGANLGF